MNSEQPLDVPELRHSEIGSSRCLIALSSLNSYSNMCLLNHGNIVSSITDRQRDSFFPFCDQLDNFSLLQRSNTIADHRYAVLHQE